VLSCAENLSQDQLDTVMAAIRTIEQERKNAREAEREFSREARDIAAEATWQERERQEGSNW
jgi:hypothetical protein